MTLYRLQISGLTQWHGEVYFGVHYIWKEINTSPWLQYWDGDIIGWTISKLIFYGRGTSIRRSGLVRISWFLRWNQVFRIITEHVNNGGHGWTLSCIFLDTEQPHLDGFQHLIVLFWHFQRRVKQFWNFILVPQLPCLHHPSKVTKLVCSLLALPHNHIYHLHASVSRDGYHQTSETLHLHKKISPG